MIEENNSKTKYLFCRVMHVNHWAEQLATAIGKKNELKIIQNALLLV